MSRTLDTKKIKSKMTEKQGKTVYNTDIAEACGVTVQQVTNWDSGRNQPKLESLLILQKLTELSLRQMTKFTKKKRRKSRLNHKNKK